MPRRLRRSSIRIADVRQDEIDAGQVVAGKGDAEIDRDPLRGGARCRGRRARDSCRSRRRRRAAQRRARRRGPPSAHRRRPSQCSSTTSPAAIDLRPPSGSDSTSRPASSTSSKRPTSSRSGEAHADVLAAPGGARQPVGADGREMLAVVPLRQPPEHLGRQRREQRLGGHRGAGRGKIGGRIVGVGGMADAIDADADDDAPAPSPALAFDQDAGELLAVEQQIVRPFDRELRPQRRRRFGDRVMDRERGDEGELRPMLRRRGVGQQQATQTDCRAPTPRCGRAGRVRRSGGRR